MARLLALEWDAREARVVVAQKRGATLVVQHAFAVPLESRTAGQATTPADVSPQIAAALSERNIARGDALLAIGRTNIELKLLKLPPAPPAELPQMVRFQALREFHSLAEDCPLDFFPLDQQGEQQTVLAATIDTELVAQILQTCSGAGLRGQRLVLRPCAAAALLREKLKSATHRVSLLVDVLSDEADLSVLVADKLVFTRTARLPAPSSDSPAGEERHGALLGELRRTMIAVQNQQPGGRVEAVYLCGSVAEDTALAETIGTRLNLPVHLLDPFANLDIDPACARSLPDRPGAFAPLLGMLLDEVSGERPAIDFLQPRRAEREHRPRRPLYLVGGLAAAVMVALGMWTWMSLTNLDDEIEQLIQRSKQLDKEVKIAAQSEKEVGEIDDWQASDVHWLEELAYLSAQFPASSEAIALRLRMTPAAAGGRIDLDGGARTAGVIDAAEQGLRDSRHAVEGQGSHQEEGSERYQWRFGAAVHVLREPTGAAP